MKNLRHTEGPVACTLSDSLYFKAQVVDDPQAVLLEGMNTASHTMSMSLQGHLHQSPQSQKKAGSWVSD